MNALKIFCCFSLGFVTGALVMKKIIFDKEEQRLQEEIQSVKDTYRRIHEEQDKDDVTDSLTNQADEPDTLSELKTIVYDNGYDQSSENCSTEKRDKPYVISPEDFGAAEGYENVSLTFFADEVLVDEKGELVDDVENTIGIDSLTHFGEYEDDSVFVRNDKLRCDFEILQDYRAYGDVHTT